MNKRFTIKEVEKIFTNSGNSLADISLKYNSTKLFDPECIHYIDYYWKYFKELRNKPISLLEIGVKEGDSIKIWEDFFHPESTIIGIDIDISNIKYDFKDKTEIYEGDQTDLRFLQFVLENREMDIIIDDGGHTQYQLITSFQYLFQYGLKEGGQYVMEDLGCSYWHKWSGGINLSTTAIEFLKTKIDSINHEFWKGGRTDYVGIPKNIDADYFDKNISGIKLHKGIGFIEK